MVHRVHTAPFQQLQAFSPWRDTAASAARRELGEWRCRSSSPRCSLLSVRVTVDIVAEGHDAGVRLSEIIEPDMVQVRLTDAFRFVVVGAPEYLKRHGVPERPQDLLRHECITFRSQTTSALYAWELERGRKNHLGRLARGAGPGLAYAPEPVATEHLRAGRLKTVLEAYAPTVPGFFLYFPSVARRSAQLTLFVDAAKELAVRGVK